MDFVSTSAEAYALFDTQATVEPPHDRAVDVERAPFVPEGSGRPLPVSMGMLAVAAYGAIMGAVALVQMLTTPLA